MITPPLFPALPSWAAAGYRLDKAAPVGEAAVSISDIRYMVEVVFKYIGHPI